MAILGGMRVCTSRGYDVGFAWRPRRKVGGREIDPARDLLPGIDFYVPPGTRYPSPGNHDEMIDAATRHFAERYETVYCVAWIGDRSFQDFDLSESEQRVFRAGSIDASRVELALAPAVEERVERVLYRNDLADCLGVHVRRGDVQEHVESPGLRAFGRDIQRFVALDRYFEHIDGAFGSAARRIFLCTESVEVVGAFEKKYGESAVLSMPLADDHRGSVEGMQQALSEMVLLSRCRSILCSRSAFSRVAISLGNRPHAILAPDGTAQVKSAA